MVSFSIHPYFGNSVEEFHLNETLSTPTYNISNLDDKTIQKYLSNKLTLCSVEKHHTPSILRNEVFLYVLNLEVQNKCTLCTCWYTGLGEDEGETDHITRALTTKQLELCTESSSPLASFSSSPMRKRPHHRWAYRISTKHSLTNLSYTVVTLRFWVLSSTRIICCWM